MCRQDGDISRRRRVRNPSKSALPTSLESAESRSYHGMVVNHTKVQLLTRIPIFSGSLILKRRSIFLKASSIQIRKTPNQLSSFVCASREYPSSKGSGI
jgi:hypothetical protein